MDAKEYIKQKIKISDPSIDVSKGSAIYDLFINPLSSILQENLDFEQSMLNNLSLKNENSMTNEEVDAIAANFLIERNVGQKASGNIRLFYNIPVAVTVPQNTIFETDDGKQYVSTRNFSTTSQNMFQNNDYYPLYHTGDIPIEAIEEGTNYITKPDTVINLTTFVSPEPASVRNLLSITQGTDKETNTQLKTKVIDSVINKSIASASGIKKVLQDNYSTITSLITKSLRDTEMVRDITYSGVEAQAATTIDFDNKISGMYVYPYNECIGYVGRFEDTDETTAIALPNPGDFTYEMTNTMYEGLFKENDPTYTELKIYNILEENFANDAYETFWVLSDGQAGYNVLLAADEITVDNQAIKLGIKENEEDTENYQITSIKPKILINVDSYNKAILKLSKLIDKTLIDQQDIIDLYKKGGNM